MAAAPGVHRRHSGAPTAVGVLAVGALAGAPRSGLRHLQLGGVLGVTVFVSSSAVIHALIDGVTPLIVYASPAVSSPPYRELSPPPYLARLVACTWEQAAPSDGAQRVVPDGCVDLIWTSAGDLVIAGADTGPRVVHVPRGNRISGIRLRPSAAGAVLGVPACELRDREVPAEAVWGAEADRAKSALNTHMETHIVLAEVIARRRAEPDRLVEAAAARIALSGATVRSVADDLGISERHLHRRTVSAVGYGPKVLGRVGRLRRLIAADQDSLAARAYAAGYASQSHMSDEVRRLTGTTPVRFLEDARLTAA